MTFGVTWGGENRSCFFSEKKEGFGLQGAEKRGAALQSPSPRSSAFLISIMVDLDSSVTLYISATSRRFLRHTDQHLLSRTAFGLGLRYYVVAAGPGHHPGLQ